MSIVTKLVLPALITSLAFTIWRISRRIWSTYQHVDEDTMRDFWIQRLKSESPEEHQRVIDHLGVCNSCRQLLDDIKNEKLIIEQKRISRRF
jgi:hypothetical protein